MPPLDQSSNNFSTGMHPHDSEQVINMQERVIYSRQNLGPYL